MPRVRSNRSRCVALSAFAYTPLELLDIGGEELRVRAQTAPDVFEHPMQDRASIHRFDAQAHLRQRFRAQTQLRLSAECAARLQLDRARSASGRTDDPWRRFV